MDLAQLTDQPTWIAIGGKSYGFSEIPFGGLGELQAWLKDNTPHPLRSLAGQLDGFSEEEKAELLRQAREDAKSWPPVVGTAAGAAALLATEAGQLRALWVALKVHQPATTLDEARRLYKALQGEAARLARARRGKAPAAGDAEAKVSRIFAIAFGMDGDDQADEGDGPKA